MTLLLKVEFHTFWHISSGATGSSDINTTVVKDTNAMPYIPGKTLKGVIKDSAKLLKKDDFILNIFGDGKKGEKTVEAPTHFSNAVLSKEDFTVVKDSPSLLFSKISSTELENSIAVKGSLRTIEVVVPLALYCEILNFNKEYLEDFKLALALTKRMGYKRARGLGECTISVREEK